MGLETVSLVCFVILAAVTYAFDYGVFSQGMLWSIAMLFVVTSVVGTITGIVAVTKMKDRSALVWVSIILGVGFLVFEVYAYTVIVELYARANI